MITIGNKVVTWRNIKQLIGILIILFILFWAIFYKSITIENYTADVTLDVEGNMHVIEQWDMTYYDSFFSFLGVHSDPMKVRFRDIGFNKYPEDYNFPQSASNIAIFDESVTGVNVLKNGVDMTDSIRVGYSYQNDRDELGQLITCEPASSDCESIFVDTTNIGGLLGNYTFIYEYSILGAVTQYSDVSELNWVLLNYAEAKIKHGEVILHLPNASSDLSDLYIWGHGIANGYVNIENTDLVKITFKNMKADDFLEFRLLAPNVLFPLIDSNNILINDDVNLDLIYNYENELVILTNQSITSAIILFASSVAVVLIMLGTLAYYNKKYFQMFKTEEVGEYLRELPSDHSPAEVGYLYRFKKTKTEDITATLLDLINRDYIKISNSKVNMISENASYDLELNTEKSRDNLKEHEKHLIEWFFKTIGNGIKVKTKDIENYGAHHLNQARSYTGESIKFTNLIQDVCDKQDFFDSTIEIKKSNAMMLLTLPFIAVFSIIIMGIIFYASVYLDILMIIGVSVYYGYYVSTRKRRSKNGQLLYKKWYAFKHFLEDFGSFEDYPIPSIEIWEHYLAYATVFGIADKVMDQLKVRIEKEQINLENSKFFHEYYYMDSRRSYHTTNLNHVVKKAKDRSNYRMSQALSNARTSSALSSFRSTGSSRSAFSSRPSSFGRSGGSSGRSSRGGGFSGGSSRGGGHGGGRSR
ncbi:MAG: DUF2207 domain-containing protein [Firmicutes bacterium]|nr:DUF2207 domain-containing protein [Bacillota bacterium]